MLLLSLIVLGLPAQQPQPAARQLGAVHFPTSCAAPAQARFDRAVALLHSFAFALATAEFQAVLQADSACAMAWWGLALSAWGNPFAAGIKPPPQLERGLAAVRRGRALRPASPREAAYLEAAATLYEGADSLDQRRRLLGYRDAMAALAAREPGDTEAAIFHALALAVSADPADKSYAAQLAAGATLERLWARLPNHPGLAHYLIHSYDVPPLAPRALDAAQRYGRIAPAVSHALHMPSHTYTRVGSWQQSIAANEAAVRAARREGAIAEALHTGDYRTYAHLQLGQDAAVRRILAELPALAARLDPAAIGTGGAPAAGYYAIAAVPARYALERRAWREAARLELRPSPVPFADAVTWFARGLGAARSGDTTAAAAAIAALSELRDGLARAGESYWSDQVAIQARATQAWLTWAQGRRDSALALMRQAAEQEDGTEKNAITPGPLAPARELLGEMLLEAGRPALALEEFRATLAKEPRRWHALAGAARAAHAAGDSRRAAGYAAALLRLGARADRSRRPELLAAERLARP